MNKTMASQSASVEAITRWLQKQIEEKRSRVVLKQRTVEGEQVVRDWRLQGASANELAAAIHDRALEDATNQAGQICYCVYAYVDGHKSYVDRTLLYVEGGAEDEIPAPIALRDDAEARIRFGVVDMLMQHTNASAHLALGQTLRIVQHYKDENERKDTRIRELEDKHAKVLKMYEELLSMRHERELELLKAQNAEKRKDHLLDKLDMLIPVAMSKVLPAGKTPALGEELMRQLLKSLKREQLEAIVGNLSPEQAALIHEIYVAYAAREETRDAKKVNGTNGAAGAPGGSS